MATYNSHIVLGGKYKDVSGIEGRAVVISFHEYACERVIIEYVEANDLKMIEVDAARLTPVGAPMPQPAPVPTGATSTGRAVRSGRRPR